MEAVQINKFFTGEGNGRTALVKKISPALRRFPFRERCIAGEVFTDRHRRKSKKFRLPHVHSPAVQAIRRQMSIVKALQLPNAGSCEAGLLKGSFWTAWALCRETDKQGSYGAGVQHWTLATRPLEMVEEKLFAPSWSIISFVNAIIQT